MRNHVKNEKGMSLVEATIILLILAVLTAVFSPSMSDFLEDARGMKVKEDVESLGIGIKRLLRDTGLKGLRLAGTTGFTLANRVEILSTSAGTAPSLGTGVATFTSAGDLFASGDLNWIFTGITEDTFEDQLVYNVPAYTQPTEPNRGRGWRGAYINANPGADPWGYKYYANVAFLTVATDATNGSAEGDRNGYWNRDVVVLSAGPDNIINTEVEGTANGGSGNTAANDDVIFVLQGHSY